MNMGNIVSSGIQEFKQIIEKNCNNLQIDNLTPDTYQLFTDCLKEALSSTGKVMITNFLNEYDVNEESIQFNGELYKNKIISKKKFLTFFGEIELKRTLYQKDRGGKCYIPLDDKWGVTDEYASPDIQDAVLYSSAHMIPCEVEKLLEKCAFFNPSATAVQNMIEKSAKVIEKNEDEIYTKIILDEEIPKETEILAASLDGANVLLREKGSKKGRKLSRPKKGENNNEIQKSCYKNAMVGTISYYKKRKDGEKHPDRLETKYIARMPENRAITFKERFELSIKNVTSKLTNNPKKIMILDGARKLWNYVNNNTLFDDYEKLVDFYHTTEHLSIASEIIFGKKNDDSKKWFNEYRKKLLNIDNGAYKVIRSLEYYLNKIKKGTQRYKDLKRELTFFRNNKNKMNYLYFLENGWPIGSGPVEAACKTIVKQRLCRSGMRWLRKGGQAILNLRTIVKSNRWENFWEHFQMSKQFAYN